jgi:hypothetical protein
MDPGMVAKADSGIGRIYLVQGNWAKAIAHLQRALRFEMIPSTHADHLWTIATTLGDLGNAHFGAGEKAEAKVFLQEADALFRKMGVGGSTASRIRHLLEKC